MEATPREHQRFKDPKVTSAIFKTLHEPPELHGFHRTNWRQVDLYAALKNIGHRRFHLDDLPRHSRTTNINGERQKLSLRAMIQNTNSRLETLNVY